MDERKEVGLGFFFISKEAGNFEQQDQSYLIIQERNFVILILKFYDCFEIGLQELKLVVYSSIYQYISILVVKISLFYFINY